MADRKFASIFLLIFTVLVFVQIDSVHGWRKFWKGRHYKGNLHVPIANVSAEQLPPDRWFAQKLDHFDPSNTQTWNQVSSRTASHLYSNFT